MAVGALVFGVPWGDPVAAAALVLMFAVVATAVGLLVGTVARDTDQASAIGTPVAIALGMLGGCMWPLSLVPPVMRTIGHVAPQAWAMDGWTTLIFDTAGRPTSPSRWPCWPGSRWRWACWPRGACVWC